VEKPMKLLMILYYYPPVREVGTVRNVALVQHLLEMGVEPVVLTAANPDEADWIKIDKDSGPAGVAVHRVNGLQVGSMVNLFGGISNRLHRLILGKNQPYNLLREHLFFPDLQMTYQPAFLRRAKELMTEQGIQYVFISCSPFSSALLAPALKRAFPHVKIIVDFRDGWRFNPHIEHSRRHWQRIEKKEPQIMAKIDLFVANTPGMARLYKNAYPDLNMITVPNGFDTLTPKTKISDRFIIIHTGIFYGRRNPDNLLAALEGITVPIEFRQIGSPLQAKVNNPMVTIRSIPPVPRQELLMQMQEASLLYLKQGFEGEDIPHIAIAAKTFEYLATGIPILADVPAGDNADLIRAYGHESHVITSGNPEEIRQALQTAYQRWQSGKINYTISPAFIHDFDRRQLVRSLYQEIITLGDNN
jgi:glycosyltransferase involved in cell wall biosynthesis